jgi:hypothetical protein
MMSAYKSSALRHTENVRSSRRRTPSASKRRRLPYLAAVATALAFAFLGLIVIGISPMP